jgi:hypothetical protein
MTETFILAALEPKQPKQTLLQNKTAQHLKTEEDELQRDLSKKMLIVEHVPKMLFQLLMQV